MMNKINKLFLFLFLAPLISFIGVSSLVCYYTFFWTYSGPETTFSIQENETFSHINYRLKEANLIPSSRIFHHFVKFHGDLNKFKVGAFKIPLNYTLADLLYIFTKSKPVGQMLTIPEGKNIYDIAKIVEKNKIGTASEFLQECFNKELLNQFQIPAESVEGYLFPDSYLFSFETKPATIIKFMVNHFFKKIQTIPNLTSDPEELFKIVTLASIVEKETGAGHERPMIAGVFQNRLKKNIPLQSDPTTIYGLFPHFDGNLKRAHLKEKTPYNTYALNGLPKGPISNPGLESINAVLNPAKHKFIYFVSKNDGTHIFTSTYEEHLKAVEYYQKNKKAREGKSWRQLNNQARSF
jgi:UPF0755 protein